MNLYHFVKGNFIVWAFFALAGGLVLTCTYILSADLSQIIAICYFCCLLLYLLLIHLYLLFRPKRVSATIFEEIKHSVTDFSAFFEARGEWCDNYLDSFSDRYLDYRGDRASYDSTARDLYDLVVSITPTLLLILNQNEYFARQEIKTVSKLISSQSFRKIPLLFSPQCTEPVEKEACKAVFKDLLNNYNLLLALKQRLNGYTITKFC